MNDPFGNKTIVMAYVEFSEQALALGSTYI